MARACLLASLTVALLVNTAAGQLAPDVISRAIIVDTTGWHDSSYTDDHRFTYLCKVPNRVDDQELPTDLPAIATINAVSGGGAAFIDITSDGLGFYDDEFWGWDFDTVYTGTGEIARGAYSTQGGKHYDFSWVLDDDESNLTGPYDEEAATEVHDSILFLHWVLDDAVAGIYFIEEDGNENVVPGLAVDWSGHGGIHYLFSIAGIYTMSYDVLDANDHVIHSGGSDMAGIVTAGDRIVVDDWRDVSKNIDFSNAKKVKIEMHLVTFGAGSAVTDNVTIDVVDHTDQF